MRVLEQFEKLWNNNSRKVKSSIYFSLQNDPILQEDIFNMTESHVEYEGLDDLQCKKIR